MAQAPPAAPAAAVPRKKRDRTPQHATSRDYSRRWLDDFHSSEDVPPFFAWSRQREQRERRQRQQGQASSSSGATRRRANGRASGAPLRADEEEEQEQEEAAGRDTSRTTNRRQGGREEVDMSETYLSEYQV